MRLPKATEIESLSAHEQLELFRSKQLSPVEVLKAQVARIEHIDASINACTEQHFDQAFEAAREAESRYQRGDPRELEGVTVALKDEYGRRGWKVTSGSVLYKDDIIERNHPLVDRLLAAGAIPHIQTTVPEFFLVAVTWSDLWGITRNPWNLDWTPGGSSGGAAAALAAGMTTLAIGSDMGGSIRIPCALTGLYGFKPSYGRIGSPDAGALVPQASPGPMARDARDMVLLQNILSGPARGCPAVVRPPVHLETEVTKRRFKVALSLDQSWARLETDVRDNTHAAAKLLQQAGVIVEEVDLKLGTTERKLREAIEKALFSSAIGGELCDLAPQAEQLTSYGRHFVGLSSRMGPRQAKEAAEETLRLYRCIEDRVFDRGYDALMTPTVGTTRIAADYDPTKDVPVIGGEQVDPYAGWFLTSLFNLINWMPAAAVPSGFAANSVPTGVQIACRPYEDETAASLAVLYGRIGPTIPFDRILRS